MAISFLDKVPFTSAARFSAAHCFAGFHRAGSRATASVALCGLRPMPGLSATVFGARGWRLSGPHGASSDRLTFDLAQDQILRLLLEGPADLRGRQNVRVRLTHREGKLIEFGVAPAAASSSTRRTSAGCGTPPRTP